MLCRIILEILVYLFLIIHPICGISCFLIADSEGASKSKWAILGLLFGVITLYILIFFSNK